VTSDTPRVAPFPGTGAVLVLSRIVCFYLALETSQCLQDVAIDIKKLDTECTQ
jgi:hypothetical protein